MLKFLACIILGFYNGGEDYYGKNISEGVQFPSLCDGKPLQGYDFHDNDEVDLTAKGDYSTFQYERRARDLIAKHNKENDQVRLQINIPEEYNDFNCQVSCTTAHTLAIQRHG